MGNRIHWFAASSIAAVLHAGAWQHFAAQHATLPVPAPLPTVEVSLIAAPAEHPVPERFPEPLSPPVIKLLQRTLQPVEPTSAASTDSIFQDLAELPAPAAIVPITASSYAPSIAVAAAEVRAPSPSATAAIEPPRFNAAYLDNPPPAYPLAARRRGIEGKVLVRVEVQGDGNCSQALLKQSSGDELLDQAALSAVKNWHFVPAKQGERTMAAWVDVPIVFKLQD